MKIISLLENTTNKNLKTEHGLSLYVEALDRKILFDFGSTDLFLQNAKKLGVDLREVDFAVLSHGHNDHGGGIKAFLDINKHAPIYVNPNATSPHYNKAGEYIGLDLDLIKEKRLIFVEKQENIHTGLTVFNCNNNAIFTPIVSNGHTKEENGVRVEEDYNHEQYLLINENGNRVLLSGCSHKGITNIMEWIKPTHLIGGFHYSKLPLDNALIDCAAKLNEYDTEYYTCHCTGVDRFEYMKMHMKALHYLACGDEIVI